MKPIATVILAAGEGKRMHSDLPKVCHVLDGRPLVVHCLALAQAIGSRKNVVVLSGQAPKAKRTREVIGQAFGQKRIIFATQKKPRGTGDAVRAAAHALKTFSGTVLILYGDVPLLSPEVIRDFLAFHHHEKAVASLISVHLENPTGYGRIVRSSAGLLQKIVEEKDASDTQRRITEINSGIYAVDRKFLFDALAKIKPHNAQKEFYLTDVIAIARDQGVPVAVWQAPNHRAFEFLGVNSQKDLAVLENYARQRRNAQLMGQGVKMWDPASTVVSPLCQVESGAVLFPGVHLLGKTIIKKNSSIGPYAILTDVRVGESVTIKPFCVLENVTLENEASCGPFAHLRPGSVLKKGAKVGNFVEMKKSVLGVQAKANHLSYIGDAFVGAQANIGAGTITCNYDGFSKYATTIGAGAFIGSDTQLVAPVRVGNGAIVGAGTTVTKNVPDNALAISRSQQINKKNWATRFRQQAKRKK